MYLKSVTVHGFRAANEHPLECELPGRFSVLLGANSAGKSPIVDSIVMSHRRIVRYLVHRELITSGSDSGGIVPTLPFPNSARLAALASEISRASRYRM